MKNGRSGIPVIAVLVVAALALAFLGPMLFQKQGTKSSVPEAQLKYGVLNAKGVVESEDDVTLASQVAGAIREIRVREGDSIKKGQPLLILDSGKVAAKVEEAEAVTREARDRLRELEAGSRVEDVEMARARVARAEAVHKQASNEYLRQQRLLDKDATTKVERDQAEERLNVAAAELNDAMASLQKYLKGPRREEIERAKATVSRGNAEQKYYRSIIREYTVESPIDGLVTERLKEPGEAVDVGAPLMKLIDPLKLRVRAEVEESDVGKVKEGQAVEVSTDAYGNRVFRGTVTKVFPYVKKRAQKTFDPMASFDINTQQIYIRMDDFTGLENGMTVTVRFLK